MKTVVHAAKGADNNLMNFASVPDEEEAQGDSGRGGRGRGRGGQRGGGRGGAPGQGQARP